MVEQIFRTLRFGEIFWHNAPYSIAKVDLGGRVVEANQTLCTLLGYSENELKGLLFDEITHPEDLLKDRKLFGNLVDRKIKNYTMAKRYLTKSKITLFAQLYVYGVYDQDGKIEYVIGMILPVSGYNTSIWGYVARDFQKVKKISVMIGMALLAYIVQKLFGIDISGWF